MKSWIRNSLSFREHYSRRLFVRDSRSSTCFSIYDFEFVFNELNVRDSTTSRWWCEKLVWTRFFFFFLRWFVSFHSTFSDNFVMSFQCAMSFILCVDVSLSLSLQHTFCFRRAWSREKDLLTRRRFLSISKHIVESLKRSLRSAHNN
jgi:hypothetical protein